MDGPNCTNCGVELVDGTFWPSWTGRANNVCRDCDNERRNERRRNGAEPNRSRRNKVAYCDHPECYRILREVVLSRGHSDCGICHDPIEGEWHMDHIIPVSKKGKHCYYNLQPSHPECNLLKGDTILVE